MQKSRGRAVLAFAFILTLCLTFGAGAAKQETAGASPQSGPAACYPCHPQTQSLKEGSKHAGLPCSLCHENTSAHLASFSVKPKTRIDASLCGGCHRNQYESSQKVNYEAPARKEKGIPTGRSPLQEKLLAPHGFTKEHNEPRAHVFMVTDQFIVDRFAGGRFQYKKGVRGVDESGRAWDVLYDTGRELPETARAGNATCISCKTTDHLLTWKYMGDKNPKAQWDRGSDAIAISKATSNPMSCVHCHDAHGAVPRVVRDALIEAVDKEGARTFAGKDGKTDLRYRFRVSANGV
jgi:formate-dependent nitrite reductase cytochrome c552 subunit